MANKKYINKLEKLKNDGWISVDERLPLIDGEYNTIIHQGSMSISLSDPTIKLFKNGSFPRMDWNYVILWKEI